MPIRYVRSDAHRLAVLVIAGPFNPGDLVSCVKQHRVNGGWSYGVLYDLRQLTHPDRFVEVTTAIARPSGGPPRGPTALLITDSVIHKRASAYAAAEKVDGPIEVFSDEELASTWLSAYPASVGPFRFFDD